MADGSALRRVCGELVVGGFEGTELPGSYAKALAAGERGGVVLFARNLTQDPMQCAALARAVAAAAPKGAPPLIAIDQEGGRVQRLQAPVLQLPPMRAFGKLLDAQLARDCAEALARQLAALGVTMDFAPVLDVDMRDDNPIIGDRAFSHDKLVVAELGCAWTNGLRDGGVLACGKHFPGHGNTSKDSHLDLPVDEAWRSIHQQMVPFRMAAAEARIPALMTAHVVFPSFDAELPATFSRKALVEFGRGFLGFGGCFFSDDLEMKAIADRWSIEESAVRAIDAGCDVLLICKSEELQARAVDALAKRATDDAAFAARCREARERFLAMRKTTPPRPVTARAEFDAASARARELEGRLAEKLGSVA